MKQFLERFKIYLLAHKRSARNTVISYCRDIEQCLTFLESLAVISCESITKQDLVQYLDHMKKQGLSARSVRRKISALRLFFKYLKHYAGLEIRDFDLIFPRILQKLPLYCTQQEIEAMITCNINDITQRGIRDHVIVQLLYATGLRVSELAHLRISDIHFDSERLDVCGKGGRMRSVPLVSSLCPVLKRYIETVLSQFSLKKKSCNLLFPTKYAGSIKPISRQAIWGIVKRFAQDAAITKPISPHTLRHSLATHSLQQGWDLRSLQMLLGHENIATVQVYTHIELSHLKSMYLKRHPRSQNSVHRTRLANEGAKKLRED